MSEERCWICGCKLIKTKDGKLFCINHGLIEGEWDSSEEEPKYIV